jgi:hypothetical protein
VTIDEAMALVRQFDECLIVWHRRTGEILSVGDSAGSPGDSLALLLQKRTQPTVARFFDSAKVTREALTHKALDLTRGEARQAQFDEWEAAPMEVLVEVLEMDKYAPPMSLGIDSGILVDHIWVLHRDELTLDHRRRLGALVGGPRLGQEASDYLALYLAALAGDVAPIRSRCDAIGRDLGYEDWPRSRLLSCVVHLQLGDEDIIDALIQCVATPTPFGPRFDAMVALGSLKPAVGTPAADVIEQHIYESGHGVAAVRSRVLEHLRSSPESWVACRQCCHGKVHGPPRDTERTCPECLGLGLVRRPGSKPISDGPT